MAGRIFYRRTWLAQGAGVIGNLWRLLLGFGVVTLDGVALAERVWSDEA
jgi:hypothetical protein